MERKFSKFISNSVESHLRLTQLRTSLSRGSSLAFLTPYAVSRVSRNWGVHFRGNLEKKNEAIFCLNIWSKTKNSSKSHRFHDSLSLISDFLRLQRAWGFFDPLFSKIKLFFKNSFIFPTHFHVLQHTPRQMFVIFMKKHVILLRRNWWCGFFGMWTAIKISTHCSVMRNFS